MTGRENNREGDGLSCLFSHENLARKGEQNSSRAIVTNESVTVTHGRKVTGQKAEGREHDDFVLVLVLPFLTHRDR